MGRCMCGSLDCPSCGPTQGNSKCPHCGATSEDGGCKDPKACADAEKQHLDGMADFFQWERDHAEEIKRIIRS